MRCLDKSARSLLLFSFVSSLSADGGGGGRLPNSLVSAFSWDATLNKWKPFKQYDTVWITPQPLMPNFAVSYLNLNGPSNNNSSWQFHCVHLLGYATRTVDDRTIPASGATTIPYGKPWYSLSHFSTDFFGGSASVSFYETDPASQRTFSFKIRGENPPLPAILDFLSTYNAPYFYHAILKDESQLRQFNENGFHKGEPTFGKPDGWGLTQLDFSRQKPPKTATSLQVWNWKANLVGGIAVLEEKKLLATQYFDYIKEVYPDEWEEPPATYHVPGTRITLSYLDASIITLYNSASVKVNQRLSCWKFFPKNEPGSKWRFIPNSINYVYKIALLLQQG